MTTIGRFRRMLRAGHALPSIAMTLFSVACLLLPVGTAANAQSQPTAAPPPSGKITGRVILPGAGKAAAGATVRIQKQTVQTDASGKFAFDNVPVGTWVISSETTVSEGGFLGIGARKSRYWGFKSEWSEAGKETRVEIGLKRHGEVEATCRECHPDQATRALPVKRCVHHSGGELSPAMSAQIERHRKANEKAKREGREHFAPIPVETRTRPDGSTYQILNCESCHTAHVPTGYKRYAIAPYIERSVLCVGCHT